MKPAGLLLFLAGALAASAQDLSPGEAGSWRVFTQDEGLAESACVSVTLGAGGNVIARHPRTNALSLLNGYEITVLPGPPDQGRVYESPGGQLWSLSPDGLWSWGDGVWVAHRVPELAAHFRAGDTNPVTLLPVRQDRVLALLPERLLQVDAAHPDALRVETLLRSEASGLGRFRAMATAADGGLWLAGERGWLKIPGPLRNLKVEATANWVSSIPDELQSPSANDLPPVELAAGEVFDRATEPDGAVWLATARGLMRRAPRLWQVTGPSPGQLAPSASPTALPALPEEITGPAEWRCFLATRDGDWWLGGERDIAWRHGTAWKVFSSTNQLGPEKVIGFAESPEGRLWCATPDKVWEFDGRDWLGLRGGFGRIHALHAARNGTLWVATDQGVQRFARGAWIGNDAHEGLPTGGAQCIVEDGTGRLAVETSAGWREFEPRADVDPPRSEVQPAATGPYHEDDTITFRFRGRDKWRQTAAERLLFSHRLDEREWTPFQELHEVAFVALPAGRHYFQLRAMDRNGNLEPSPARFEFTVFVPWQRDTRLVWLLTLALGVAVFFAGLAFNRHRRLRHSYAEVERQVAERTRELELAHQELLQSQKLNALGTLAAGIAHDFNNILSIIKGSAQIIGDNLDQPAKIRTRLDRIKTVVQQGAGIVEAMLGFSRPAGQGENPCRVNAVVESTVTLLGDRFLREVELRFEHGAELPEVSAPRDFVQQVLLNLILNAREALERCTAEVLAPASPADQPGREFRRGSSAAGAPVPLAGKNIILATRLVAAPPVGCVLPPVAAERYVAVSVQDNGCGIAPEILPRIFEPFFTTKALSARRGTGLGLSMVYELARKIGAGLAVETALGVGSTFTLLLPVQSAPAVARQPEGALP